jgi:hypothetical protein
MIRDSRVRRVEGLSAKIGFKMFKINLNQLYFHVLASVWKPFFEVSVANRIVVSRPWRGMTV